MGAEDRKKREAARAALDEVEPGSIIGVGTGSTTNHFIDLLAKARDRIDGAVASSEATASRLVEAGVRLVDLNEVERLPLYVDGADEATREGFLIKGGGGALTREKIVAAASDRFLCVIHDAKLVKRLGAFALPVEVIPIAIGLVARELRKMGGDPTTRDGLVTDNGNRILDVRGFDFADPVDLEGRLNQIPGLVANGLFCRRPADRLLVAGGDGVERFDTRR